MAYGNLGDIEAKLQWLEVSGWSSIKAGDEVNGNATVSEVLKAKLDRGDDAAELAERIAQQRTKHAELEANATNDNDRQTSGRWVMNSDYHLALIAEKNRDADELCRLIGLLDESDYVDLMVEGKLDRLKEVLRELMRSDVI